MRINPKRLSKLSNISEIKKSFISVIVFGGVLLIESVCQAQIAIGFNEALMGNSGTAISNSTAPSFYNPALLLQKKNNSFSLSGNTFVNFSSKNEYGNWSSAKLMPNYFSSIQAFESFVHEFFLATQFSYTADVLSNSNNFKSNINIQAENYFAGYSFAFHGLPVGFQIGLRSNESRTIGNQDYEDSSFSIANFIRSTSQTLNLVIGFGGFHRINNYSIGYRILSRGANIYNKGSGEFNTSTYNKTTNQFSKNTQRLDYDPSPTSRAYTFILGQGFIAGDHEFLTDAQFLENEELTGSYRWSQTFGYRYNLSGKYQYMCGLSHLIDKDINYFGQYIYVSTGLSWLSNTHRSGIGGFYSQSKIKEDSRSFGITFNSEFVY